MKTLIAGNWKLNPSTLAEAEMLAGEIKIPQRGELETVLLPPFVFLEELIKKFPHFIWGAQNFFNEDVGPYTGEVSLPMLRSIGARCVLVGHSDRRRIFGESDEVVNKKLRQALQEGFYAILCVGEFEQGAENILLESLKRSTDGIESEELSRLTIAYEPVWAISTNPNAESDTPEHAEGVIARLKEKLDIPYIYGGSVTSLNIRRFLARPLIRGALVGSASLQADEFSKILEIAAP